MMAIASRKLNITEGQAQVIVAREGRVRFPYLMICAGLPLLWEGVPFAAVGLPRAGGYYATSIAVAIGIVLFIIRKMNFSLRFNKFTVSSMALAALFLIISVVSGLMFFTNPISDWFPELVYYSPCLLIFLILALDIRLSEIAWGIAIAAAFSAILVIIDSYSNLPMMESYLATSGFDYKARRIMLLKNEIGAASCLAFAWAATTRSFKVMAASAVILALVFFDLVKFIETRLVIGAVLLTMVAFTLLVPRLNRKIMVLVAGLVLAVTVAPLLFDKYIDQLEQMGSLSEDNSVSWRIQTVDHYQKYFDQTYGLGFGLMSLKEFKNNIISYSIWDAPTLYGIEHGAWGFFLADTSYYGALFQFGYLGVALVLFMTCITAYSLIRYGLTRGLPYREAMAALGFFVLFLSILSPWPTNLFTLTWSMLSGNMLFACAARAAYIRQVAMRAPSPSGRRVARAEPQAAVAA